MRLKIWLLLCLSMFFSGCSYPTQLPATPVAPTTPANFTATPTEPIIIPIGPETATPFLPNPVTGTPPPTSTPFPTPIPPSPTPWQQANYAPPSAPVAGIPAPFPPLSADHHINFLLLGSDSRGGVSFRTDSIIIVTIDPETTVVTLISVPRDLWVYIPGWTLNRINTAYLHGELNGYPGGGIGQIKDTIRYNLGIRIDHVALVDFDGFRKIVDTIGGVDIPMVCPFTEWAVIDPNISIQYESNWELITLGPGMVHMDGAMALWYARARSRSSDFDRGRRQQEVIRALFQAAVSQNLILQAPQLWEDYSDTITTDVNLQKLISLVPVALKTGQAHIQSFYIGDDLTWGWTTSGGASVLLPNRPEILDLIVKAYAAENTPPEEAEDIIIQVQNASGDVDLHLLAAERLHYAGYETKINDAAAEENSGTRLIIYNNAVPKAYEAELLEVLGLNPGDAIRKPDSAAETDILLLIGNDFAPCFDPTREQ